MKKTEELVASLITVSIRLVQATLQAVPGRKSKYEKLGGEIELEMAWQPLISTPGSAEYPQNMRLQKRPETILM